MTADISPSRKPLLRRVADNLRGVIGLPPAGFVRYRLEMGDDIDRVVKNMATQNDIPMGEVLRRAVAVYAYFDKELGKAPGLKISQTDSNNRVLKDIYLP